jgi:hypothetical protein
MANGWAPRTGEEFFYDLGRQMRMMGRRPSGQSAFDDPAAIDASTAPELDPLDEYNEGEDDYPVPQPPGVGDLPPDNVETVDYGDSLPEEEDDVEAPGPLVLAVYTTSGRPDADLSGIGAVIMDSTIGLPIFSDGTVWKTFDGTVA